MNATAASSMTLLVQEYTKLIIPNKDKKRTAGFNNFLYDCYY